MLKIMVLLEGNIKRSLYLFNMEELIRELIFLSKTASIAGKSDISDCALEVSNNLMMIKKAQYLGIQGDWIRNGRCFSNCIRMKKHDSPQLKDQEIWSECHEEWVSGMFGKNNEAFDKYASSNVEFVDQLKDKIKNGMDLSEASWKSLLEQNFSVSHEISRNAKILRQASSFSSYVENSELRSDLVKIARQLDIMAEKEFNYVIKELFNEGELKY